MSETKITTKPCKACGNDIAFLQTFDGRWIATELTSIELGDHQFEKGRHQPHYAVCEKPDKFVGLIG